MIKKRTAENLHFLCGVLRYVNILFSRFFFYPEYHSENRRKQSRTFYDNYLHMKYLPFGLTMDISYYAA